VSAAAPPLACGHDVPRAHWARIYGTNPLEQLNSKIKRRTNVIGIFQSGAIRSVNSLGRVSR